ncbi:hypothetical protein [Pantoea cypripedii]|uniref:Uncharacterized protein n=1 Tax=Pantoea cypripedii TaxID=55209 RepID=A0A6B9G8M8_PANCY|nr:hypothetical protein [Pantoea cypripedii]QGY32183.1 hypothetical protein CUN67_24635 [Pantoea cypripedii]
MTTISRAMTGVIQPVVNNINRPFSAMAKGIRQIFNTGRFSLTTNFNRSHNVNSIAFSRLFNEAENGVPTRLSEFGRNAIRDMCSATLLEIEKLPFNLREKSRSGELKNDDIKNFINELYNCNHDLLLIMDTNKMPALSVLSRIAVFAEGNNSTEFNETIQKGIKTLKVEMRVDRRLFKNRCKMASEYVNEVRNKLLKFRARQKYVLAMEKFNQMSENGLSLTHAMSDLSRNLMRLDDINRDLTGFLSLIEKQKSSVEIDRNHFDSQCKSARLAIENCDFAIKSFQEKLDNFNCIATILSESVDSYMVKNDIYGTLGDPQ